MESLVSGKRVRATLQLRYRLSRRAEETETAAYMEQEIGIDCRLPGHTTEISALFLKVVYGPGMQGTAAPVRVCLTWRQHAALLVSMITAITCGRSHSAVCGYPGLLELHQLHHGHHLRVNARELFAYLPCHLGTSRPQNGE